MALKFIFEVSVLRAIRGQAASDVQIEAHPETSVTPNSLFALLAEFLRLPREEAAEETITGFIKAVSVNPILLIF